VRKLKLRDGVDLANLYGPHDLHLKMIEDELDVRMTARGDEIMLDGQPDSVQRAEHILQELSSWTNGYYDLKPEDISRAIQATEEQTNIPLKPYVSWSFSSVVSELPSNTLLCIVVVFNVCLIALTDDCLWVTSVKCI